jgi:hypothetical protein
MKWIGAFMLLIGYSYAAECGDFAPFHTDKTWHYQIRSFGGTPSIHVIDSLEAYWKILSIDATAGILTIRTSLTVLGSSRTVTVSNGESTMVEKQRADWDLREDFADSAGTVRAVSPSSLGFGPFLDRHTLDCAPRKNSLAEDVFTDSTIGGSRATVYNRWNNSMHAPAHDYFATGIGLILTSRFEGAVRSSGRFQAFENPPIAVLAPRAGRVPARGPAKRAGIAEGFSRSVFNGRYADGRAVARP